MNEDLVAAARVRFSTTYAEARQKFRDHAKDARTYPSMARGPEGEELSTDVAWFGALQAAKVGILLSATHGIEGYGGSGAEERSVSPSRRDVLRRHGAHGGALDA